MNLDPQQKAAVETSSSRALVLAGAGSGKTRVLIERIAYLIEEKHVSPYEIMAFTFTRKAAGEIKSRLAERIGAKAHHVILGTMHSLALQMIQRFGEIIGLKSKQVTVYSEWESSYLLKEVATDLGIYNGKTWKIKKGEIDATFNDYYSRGVEPTIAEKTYDLFHAFIGRCRENNALTYGGLLIGLRLLIPTLQKYLRIRHILVDEVQDIDRLQWSIILQMEELFGAKVFLVGDIDQSIYEWRGASPKYLVDNQDFYDIYRLEANYRSVPQIVESSNKLISHNHDRITKTMKATRESDELSVFVERDSDSEHIVTTMKTFKDFGISGVVILARVHGLLEKISRLMAEQNIPHAYIGKDTALTNSEAFRRFHAFLKLLVNPYDNFSFLLIRDLVGVSRDQYSEIRQIAAREGKSHFQVWQEKGNPGDPYVGFFQGPGFSLPSQAFAIKHMATGSAPYRSFWSVDVEPVFQFIFRWLAENTEGTVQEYLDWLATYDIQDEIKSDEQQDITLMTIHAAKGLEWPTVIVVGCNEGILPSKHAIKDGDCEAERRLMYVAMTRAKDEIILTVRPESGEKDGRPFSEPISRFIGEAL